jgi:hypothetical protein
MAGIEDCYTSSTGSRKTLGNFVKATFFALSKTYGFLTPDLWRETKYTKSPLQVSFVKVQFGGSPSSVRRTYQHRHCCCVFAFQKCASCARLKASVL